MHMHQDPTLRLWHLKPKNAYTDPMAPLLIALFLNPLKIDTLLR